jgi:hypothetical protein
MSVKHNDGSDWRREGLPASGKRPDTPQAPSVPWTAGPWSYEDYSIVAGDYEIAAVCGVNNDDPPATGRLIAAAPDLAEALAAICEELAQGDDLSAAQIARNAGAAALSKARGESQ